MFCNWLFFRLVYIQNHQIFNQIEKKCIIYSVKKMHYLNLLINCVYYGKFEINIFSVMIYYCDDYNRNIISLSMKNQISDISTVYFHYHKFPCKIPILCFTINFQITLRDTLYMKKGSCVPRMEIPDTVYLRIGRCTHTVTSTNRIPVCKFRSLRIVPLPLLFLVFSCLEKKTSSLTYLMR